jgi:hypothetical protein
VVDGVGDFNGDGTSDILQHLIASDGTMTFRILSMNNNAVQSVATLGAIGADFQVDGIGDFNGDHTSDILLHHDANGVRTYEIIPMVNNTPQAPAFLGPLATFFSLDGIGDFNGDGTSDIALHFDTLQFGGPVRTIEIDTIVNNAVQQSNPLGPTGVDFHVG